MLYFEVPPQPKDINVIIIKNAQIFFIVVAYKALMNLQMMNFTFFGNTFST
jgi:hypothetical protein